jgi:hypothetical protein
VLARQEPFRLPAFNKGRAPKVSAESLGGLEVMTIVGALRFAPRGFKFAHPVC